MEPITIVYKAISFLKDYGNAFLKKLGYRLVPFDNYKDEEFEVDFSFPNNSPECLQEIAAGKKFYWSPKYNLDYEKYFQIKGNSRRYFKCGDNYLWIKHIP